MLHSSRPLGVLLGLSLALPVSITPAEGQALSLEDRIERDKNFPHEKPGIGDAFPDLTVYRPDGTPVRTSELDGRYQVITFGCLT